MEVDVDCVGARRGDRVEVLTGNHRGGAELHDVGGGTGRGAVPVGICNYVELIDTIFTDVEGVD